MNVTLFNAAMALYFGSSVLAYLLFEWRYAMRALGALDAQVIQFHHTAAENDEP